MLLLIDNYDSFTYNLVHYLGELGVDVVVKRNDELTIKDALKMEPTNIMLSPGPCDPEQAGICLELTKAAAVAKIPLIWWKSNKVPRNSSWQNGSYASFQQRYF